MVFRSLTSNKKSISLLLPQTVTFDCIKNLFQLSFLVTGVVLQVTHLLLTNFSYSEVRVCQLYFGTPSSCGMLYRRSKHLKEISRYTGVRPDESLESLFGNR